MFIVFMLSKVFPKDAILFRTFQKGPVHRKCLSIAISGYSYVTYSDVFFTKNKNVDRFQLVFQLKKFEKTSTMDDGQRRHRGTGSRNLEMIKAMLRANFIPCTYGDFWRFFNESSHVMCFLENKTNMFHKPIFHKPTCFMSFVFWKTKKTTCFINPPKKKAGGENCKNHGLINLLVLSF